MNRYKIPILAPKESIFSKIESESNISTRNGSRAVKRQKSLADGFFYVSLVAGKTRLFGFYIPTKC